MEAYHGRGSQAYSGLSLSRLPPERGGGAQRIPAGGVRQRTALPLRQILPPGGADGRPGEAHRPLPVLRPVVGLDKEEIVQIARKIGTFETSILPYEDCCTVFTPRHPRLRPILTEVEAAEEKLDVDAMVQAAVEGIERVQV